MKLHRIAPGYYETRDGRYIVVRAEGGGWWYWRPVDDNAHDSYATKRQAVEALADWLQHDGVGMSK